MGMGKWTGKVVLILVAAVLMAGFIPIQSWIEDERVANNLKQPFQLTNLRDLPLEKVTGTLFTGVLSGFRGIVVDILWMKMDTAWDQGRSDLIVPILNAITMLDPHFMDAWEMSAWHEAYNLTAKAISKYGQWDWSVREGPIKDGLAVLEKGVKWNPTRSQLYWYMGEIYYNKMGDQEKAAEWWLKAAECSDHPKWVARFVAHAYENAPDFDKALYWYYMAEKESPNNATQPGAVITIRERYLPAWQAYKRGDLKEAERLINNTLEDYLPTNRLARHFLANILEKEGRNQEALEEWERCFAISKSDAGALRRAYELREKMGIPQPTSQELEDKWWIVTGSFTGS